ncbi:site-2 protease family protein [Chloroflexota bacterium]
MGNLVNWPPSWSTLLLLPALFVGFTVHELGHALVAFMLGDTSQVERKRLTFNPLRHVSWLGLVAFLLIGFGWAKPVWVDQSRLRIRNRAFGMFLISIAGATANLLTAFLVLLGMTATVMVVWTFSGTSPTAVLEFLVASEPGPDAQGLVVAFTYYMMMVNLLLAFFNLLPLPPLDGFQALTSLFSLIRGVLKGGGEAGQVARPAPRATASEASSQSPAQIHFGIGLEYHQAGQLDEAIARYRQAITHDGGFALAYYNQGLAYWAKGRLSLATSSFKAALQSAQDPGVQTQASLRLRELAQSRSEGLAQEEREGEAVALIVPPPLESGEVGQVPQNVAPPLDPAVARRVWLRLGIGATGMLLFAFATWLFVTTVTLASVV